MIPDKINLSEIFVAHYRTLRCADGIRISEYEILFFCFFPVLLSFVSAYIIEIRSDNYLNTVVAVYAIFSALLINAQIALYTIFRSWHRASNPEVVGKKSKNDAIRERREDNARVLIREVNANLAYLIVIAALGLVLSLTFVLLPFIRKVEMFFSLCIVLHFMLTLLMAIKRTFRLFDVEFQG